MVWQRGFVSFFDFFNIFLPSVINYVISAAIIALQFPTKYQKEMEKGYIQPEAM